ncbi:autotransporter domain-containing protein [Bartonella sp. M0177]|uniref:Autotransporter beta-domain-containing protein n=1 Tax=Bartonella apihabitans TaxID=2750929 RepID=A0A1U9MCT0_9HYPH|nr:MULTISPECIES: autotransporter outer membrane beta-barrel domain-containing protein [Bartonella]AQT43340.1 Autotransporter beta-domain-containing protein [Bartonella apihabitans]MBH9993730.1 autotransporter domain-containing protein [Bartonella sp. P0291]MBH9997924.1 autotransporter domain-containing protein [Bartonella sp. M0192]MBI0000083.1 autotransporter domain-containing protein [Bartonella sp. M0191]MBI0004205.1 autotransporter domain-containing protein [Bartonella sp. M0177]
MINKYVTVKVSTFTLMLCLSLSTSASAYAEDILYNGTLEDAATKLHLDPDRTNKSIYPAASSSNNTISVSNNSNLSFDETDETHYVPPYNVIGGLNSVGEASNNKVILDGGKIQNHVYGGRIEGEIGNTNNNYVYVKDTTLSGNFFGGLAEYGTANGNRIVIESGKFSSTTKIYGGFSSGYGDTNNNNVIIHSANIENSMIYGGFATADGNAWGNHVNIASKGPIKTKVGQVIGGYLYQSGDSLETATSAKGNSVTIEENTEVTGEVYGGQISSGVGTAGGTNEDDGNRVTITGATVGGSIYGGMANGAALNNVVTITQSTVKDSIFGGSSKSVGDASFNKVFLTGVNIAEKNVTGGLASLGDATENKVTVSAKSSAQSVIGGQSQNGGATANSVAIEDATITGDVFGGISSGSSATKNIVTLMGKSVGISGSVYGGYDAAASSNDVFTGNTLNLNEFRGSMAGIYNFENYNWVLPKDIVNNDTLIHITGTNPVDLAKTSHTVSLLNDGNRLHVNDKITLIDKSKNGPDVSSLEVHQGNFIIYDMKLQQENDGYVLTAVNVTDTSDNGGDNSGDELAGRINPRSKAFSEGRVASLGFLNQAADLIANSGIRSAKAAVLEGADKAWNMNLMPFFVIDGSSNRYKTGSHADVDGFNMAVGLASGFEIANKHAVTLGAFFEYGRGTYDTYNSFATYASVHGDGDTHYTGGGILGRIDFAGTGLGLVDKLDAGQADGLYAEASFRAGHIDTDFDTNDILGITGGSSKYDSGADYYGLHGGVGYVMNFDERNSVDVYARYLWTKIDSETVNIGVDKLRFDDADSSRIRIGTRYTMAYNQQFKPFVGVAYDHEFEGTIDAHAYQLKLDKPSLEGDSGIFEAGVSMKPISTIEALSVDISGQGYIGKRQGGGGGLKIKYQF